MKWLSQKRDEVKVVADQFAVPAPDQFMPEKMKSIILQLSKNNAGIYHPVPNASCSWYEFVEEIIR